MSLSLLFLVIEHLFVFLVMDRTENTHRMAREALPLSVPGIFTSIKFHDLHFRRVPASPGSPSGLTCSVDWF